MPSLSLSLSLSYCLSPVFALFPLIWSSSRIAAVQGNRSLLIQFGSGNSGRWLSRSTRAVPGMAKPCGHSRAGIDWFRLLKNKIKHVSKQQRVRLSPISHQAPPRDPEHTAGQEPTFGGVSGTGKWSVRARVDDEKIVLTHIVLVRIPAPAGPTQDTQGTFEGKIAGA